MWNNCVQMWGELIVCEKQHKRVTDEKRKREITVFRCGVK